MPSLIQKYTIWTQWSNKDGPQRGINLGEPCQGAAWQQLPLPLEAYKSRHLSLPRPSGKGEVGPASLVVQQTVWAHLENRHDLLLNSTWVTAFHAKRTIAVLTGPVIAGFCSLGSSHWVILLSVNNRRNDIITSRLSHHEFMVLFFFFVVVLFSLQMFSLPFPQLSISGLEKTAFTHLHQTPPTPFS